MSAGYSEQVAGERKAAIRTYAHSLHEKPLDEWETLSGHLMRVAGAAAQFAAEFGWAESARVSGLLHDIGKCSAEFQAYIRNERSLGGDHSSAGALVAKGAYGDFVGWMLAYVIAGHHAGLSDGVDLKDRLARDIPRHDGWEPHTGPLPPLVALRSTKPFSKNTDKGFETAFLIRMLFSCLVDADYLETEGFYAEARKEPVERGGHIALLMLRDRLRSFMARKLADAPSTPLNALRADVLADAVAKAADKPGFFTLTVPTGGGKTLASLSFALEHACRFGLKRIVYVIPFTSIIEQTADVFRDALGTRDDILEHHASFDWERELGRRAADDEGRDGLDKLRRAAENWDVPVVATTAVQFFESLFAARTSRCRKLHNLANSVIVLDEAQTLPVKLLRPCLAALDELVRNYGVSVVLCTATQPAIRRQDAAILDKQKQPIGLDIHDDREIVRSPKRLYAALKRVTVERLTVPIADDVITARFVERPQMVTIVNSRKHARALFDTIREMDGAAHLTTSMCPRHRRIVLADLRERLRDGAPARLVATSLIEAGVDIDFPEVWRALAGLDSIAQAAGRCNREGSPTLGRVVVFEALEQKPPRDLVAFTDAARTVLRHHADPLTLEANRHYFSEVYWSKGADGLDAAKVADYTGILKAISERAGTLDFPFASIADAFRMIEEAMEPIVVPWRANDDDREAERLLVRIAASELPRANDLRHLQQYIVNIPPKIRNDWLTNGLLKPVHPRLGDTLLTLDGLALYDGKTGVRLDGIAAAADFII